MLNLAPRRLLLAGLCLAGAALACARSELPIDPNSLSVATALVIPPTSTLAPQALASPTSVLAEATSGLATATDAPSPEPPTATPGVFFNTIPFVNGSFDNDLSGWNVTPNWAIWQDGYARVNAPQNALLIQFTAIPQASEVKLHFIARSEDARSGDCLLESNQGTRHTIAADGEWHTVEIDFTLSAGTQTAISLKARNNNNCDWVHLDDVYWLVPGEPGQVSEATATPEAAPTEGAPPEPSATVEAASPTPASIPAGATFTRDMRVTAVGDNPVGAPADLVDGQTITWASLRNGTGAWVFNLGSARNVAGLRLTAFRDGNQDTTLLGIDVSTDGATWTEAYRPSGDCAGTANCQVIAQGTPEDLAFGPVTAQYLRVRSGPTRFALAEVEVAIVAD